MSETRPLPIPDERSAPFWAASAEHVLALARCSRCGTFAHPPDVVCVVCGSNEPDFHFEPVDGRGEVCSWVVMRQSFLPGFDDDLPFVLVDVALDGHDDLRLIGRLLDGPDATFARGSRVRVAFEDLAADVAVPAFQLEVTP